MTIARRSVFLRPGVGGSLLLLLLVPLGSAACGGEPSAVEPITETSSALTSTFLQVWNDQFHPNPCDDRQYSGSGDWFFGACKTECGSAVTGISATFHSPRCVSSSQAEWANKVACDDGSILVDPGSPAAYTINFTDPAGSIYPNPLGPAWGNFTHTLNDECKQGFAITGIATSFHQVFDDRSCGLLCDIGLSTDCVDAHAWTVVGARCSPLVVPFPFSQVQGVSCAVMNINTTNADARETTSTGDWDYGFLKAECGPGRYVAGIGRATMGTTTGRPGAILCCSPTYF